MALEVGCHHVDMLVLQGRRLPLNHGAKHFWLYHPDRCRYVWLLHPPAWKGDYRPYRKGLTGRLLDKPLEPPRLRLGLNSGVPLSLDRTNLDTMVIVRDLDVALNGFTERRVFSASMYEIR